MLLQNYVNLKLTRIKNEKYENPLIDNDDIVVLTNDDKYISLPLEFYKSNYSMSDINDFISEAILEAH